MNMTISQIPVFKELSEENLKLIEDAVQHMDVLKGNLLNRPDTPNGLFVVLKGMVKVFTITDHGNEVLLNILNEGDYVGLEALFGAPANYFSLALEDSQLLYVSHASFKEVLAKNPLIAADILKVYAKLYTDLEAQLTNNRSDTVAKRIVTYLKKISLSVGSDEVRVPIPLKELSVFMCIAPETLSRTMKELNSKGYFKKLSNRHYKLNLDMIEELINE